MPLKLQSDSGERSLSYTTSTSVTISIWNFLLFLLGVRQLILVLVLAECRLDISVQEYPIRKQALMSRLELKELLTTGGLSKYCHYFCALCGSLDCWCCYTEFSVAHHDWKNMSKGRSSVSQECQREGTRLLHFPWVLRQLLLHQTPVQSKILLLWNCRWTYL